MVESRSSTEDFEVRSLMESLAPASRRVYPADIRANLSFRSQPAPQTAVIRAAREEFLAIERELDLVQVETDRKGQKN